jgi:uncharacterized protein (TIGR02145 family)
MAENLNVGIKINVLGLRSENNGIPEKFCYNNDDNNCKNYGGLYEWKEMMQYHPSDIGTIGATQGLCPYGWHVPTEKEWLVLINYLGGSQIAGGKLKETGTKHWTAPNTGTTNETGFTALPSGYLDADNPGASSVNFSYGIDSVAAFWTGTKPSGTVTYLGIHTKLSFDNSRIEMLFRTNKVFSVRCIKNP